MRDGASRISRRAALGLAAGFAAALAGCSRPLPALAAPELVVRSEYLLQLKDRLRSQWGASGIRARLRIEQPPAPGSVEAYEQSGDILDISTGEINNAAKQNFLDLRPLLTAQDFPLSSLLPSAVAAYAQGSALRALPLVLGEWQFYVNAPRLAELGVAVPARWEWQDVVNALAVAVGRGSVPSSVLVAGTGWGDPNLWGAFVQGLGGRLTAGGTVDLSGAVAATTELVHLARGYGWHPDADSNPANLQWGDFYSSGFAKTAASALFAFLQPMRIYPGMVPGALQRLPTTPFPLLPARDVVPAYSGSGLALSPYTTSPQLAAEALTWLYQPEQQQILATNGWPPVVLQLAEQSWPTLQDHFPGYWAKFDAAGYTDVSYELTGGRPANSFDLGQTVEEACAAMYGGADVATELGKLQEQLRGLTGSP